MMNDNEVAALVRAVQKGDEMAFERLYAAFAPAALRTASLICGSRSSGEDVVQEAFVQALLQIGSLRKPEEFRSWFYRIMTRLAWRGSKREKRQVPVADIYDSVDEATSSDALAGFIRDEEAKALYEAISHLPDKQKAVVVLHYFSGFSVAEIARIIGTLEGTVKSRLHTARRRLYAELAAGQPNPKGEMGYEHG